jgi:enediyne biosynthesis protein E4
MIDLTGTAATRLRSLSFFCAVVFLCGLALTVGCSDAEPPTPTEPATQAGSSRPALPTLNVPPKERDVDPELAAASVRFQDVADASEMRFQFHEDYVEGRFFLPEVMGGGVGWLDFDRDGWQDAVFSNGSQLIPEPTHPEPLPMDVLFQSRDSGRSFIDRAAVAGTNGTAYGQGCAVADFDADGFPDFYVASYGDNVLYHNNGDGTFSSVKSAVLAGGQRWSTSCAWCDLNQDGLMDLYVINYMDVNEDNIRACDYNGISGYCGPGEYDALADEVLLNVGDGQFKEAARELGLTAEEGKGLAISILDFDDDLKPEIYVANDMTANSLFTRTQTVAEHIISDAPWRDLGLVSGSAVSEAGINEASMGVACADFDLDQRPDIYLTHFYHQKNTLYGNRGNLTFSDDSRRFRVTVTSDQFLGFGVVPGDFDGDGATDLFIANGHVLGPHYSPSAMLPQLLHNEGGQWLKDISSTSGDYFLRPTLGRGAAGCDFDNDGDIDIAVSHIGAPVALLQNNTPSLASGVIGLQLTDGTRNAPVGGRVELEAGSYRRSWPVGSGGSYLSSPDPRLLISVPNGIVAAPVITVHWTSGRVDRFRNLEPGSYWNIIEGSRPTRAASFIASPERH